MPNTEKRYHINPGKGEKKYTCPYSCYEDGRDAKEDIIPPKGFVLKGFEFVPNTSNKYYDGELIAQYERSPLSVRLTQNWVIFLILLLVIGITIALLCFFGAFSKSQPIEKPSLQPFAVTDSVPADTLLKSDSTVVLTDPIIKTDTVITEPKDEPKAEIPVAKEEVPTAKEVPAANETVEEQKQNTSQTQEIELPVDTPTAKFKQEFWKMIHKQNTLMDSYYSLFTKYRGKVNCKEFDYLRGTILQNTTAFKAWKGKLVSIPATELESINTVDALKQKLK